MCYQTFQLSSLSPFHYLKGFLTVFFNDFPILSRYIGTEFRTFAL